MNFKIILFGRPQCGGCQLMKPRLINVASEIGAEFIYVDLSTQEGEDIESNYPDLPASLPVVLFISTSSGEILDTLDAEDNTSDGAVWDWTESELKEYMEYNIITLTGDTFGGGQLPTVIVRPDNKKSTVFKLIAAGILGKIAITKFL